MTGPERNPPTGDAASGESLSRGELAAYFERIGYRGDGAATLETLSRLHRLHPAAIPFENLDPFLGRPVLLERRAIFDKLVGEKRGGYCFEHNALFMQVLRSLGFEVTGLAARVQWNRPQGTVAPRGHMLLCLRHDGGAWLVDVGFGGLTQTAPLRFVDDVEQPTPHEPFRVVAHDRSWLVQARIGDQWPTLYRFDLTPQFDVDYAVSSYYLSTHPQSQFVTGLLAARAVEGGRLALAGNRLTIHRTGGASERHEMATAAALLETLEDRFDIAVPEPDRFLKAAVEKGIVGS